MELHAATSRSAILLLTLLLACGACKKPTSNAGPPPSHAVDAHPPVASDENGEVIEVSNLVIAAAEGRRFEDLTEAEQVILTVWELEADVNNGGFDQYFFNSSGDHAFFAPSALEKIGAPTMAAIVSRANALFGAGGPPRDRFARQDKLEQFRESQQKVLNQLDNEFYAYPDALTALMHRYIESHAPELLARVKRR